ncbi:MAG: acyl carrier protein [Alphaproteobacteria bacterium]|nr:acyl carrier protein [Alphaproteobacteria bacterium]
MSILEDIKTIVAKNKKIDADKVLETSSFKDDLNMDSLEQAELIMELEKKYSCEIPEDAAEKIITVADAVEYLKNNTK